MTQKRKLFYYCMLCTKHYEIWLAVDSTNTAYFFEPPCTQQDPSSQELRSDRVAAAVYFRSLF